MLTHLEDMRRKDPGTAFFDQEMITLIIAPPPLILGLDDTTTSIDEDAYLTSGFSSGYQLSFVRLFSLFFSKRKHGLRAMLYTKKLNS